MDKNNLNNTYIFAGRREDDYSMVKVLKGPLQGAVIKIHTIKFGDKENPDGTLDLKINSDFIEKPIRDATKKQIDQTLGEIVVDIIQNYMMEDGFNNIIEIA